MLKSLSIRDVAIINKLDLTFSDGLCVLTGETGAGKSILLDALGLALGMRGDNALVRHGTEQAVVTAMFEQVDPQLSDFLTNNGFPVEDSILLRRVLKADGGSRAFINDQPTGVGMLRQLGERLAEIQGQFAQHRLANVDAHGELLDEFGKFKVARDTVASAYTSWRAATKALADASNLSTQVRLDEEFLRHAITELNQLAPQQGEEIQLVDTRMVLMHADQMVEAINGALLDLSGNNGAESSLSTARRRINQVADKSGGRLDSTIAALDGSIADVEDALRELGSVSATLEHDEGRLAEVEDRLQALRDTARKHNVEIADLTALTERFRERLALIDDQSGTLDRLKKTEFNARKNYLSRARALSKKRVAAALRLQKAVESELPALKLENTRLEATINIQEEQLWNISGIDRVEFLITTNPGTPPGALSKIASGGELSRLMLALKLTFIDIDRVPTLIFDEVDSAIGGATANAVGERLERLADQIQVLVVTHSPQVAARGSDHLRVKKSNLGNEVITEVNRLGNKDRHEEVARMLSGANVTTEARAAAERLISGDRS